MGVLFKSLLLSLVLLLATPHPAQGSPDTDTVTLQLKWLHSFQFAGFYMAKEKGFYRDSGLDVTMKEMSTDVDIVDDVLTGRSTYGISDSALVLTRLQGDDPIALSAIFQHSPISLLALKSSGIRDIEDLRGKKIMLDATTAQNTSILAMLKSHLGDDSIEVIPMSYDLDDLLDQRVDAYAAYISDQPITLKAKGIDYVTFTPTDHGFDFYGDLLFTSAKEIARHPLRVKKFVEASTKGWQYAYDHIEETIDVIKDKYDSQGSSREKLRQEAVILKSLSGVESGTFGTLDASKMTNIANTFAILGMGGDQTRLSTFIYSPERLTLQKEHQRFLRKHPDIVASCLSHMEPLVFMEDGTCQGYSADLLRLLAKKVGLNITFRPYHDFSSVRQGLKDDEIDMMQLASGHLSNAYNMTFSRPYYDINAVIVVQNSRNDIRDTHDLIGKRVGLLKGALTTKAVKRQYPMIDVLEYDNTKSMLEAVAFGEVDALLNDFKIMNYMIQKYNFMNLKVAGRMDASMIANDLAYAIKTEYSPLKEILDEAITSVTEEELSTLEKKWFQKYASLKIRPEEVDLGLSAKQQRYLLGKKKLTMCIPPHIPPFSYFEDGKLHGMAADYVDYFEARLHIPIEPLRSQNTADAIHQALDGKCDIHILLQDGPRSKKKFLLTTPYLDDHIVAVTKADKTFIPDLHRLRGEKMGVMEDTVMKDQLGLDYPELEVVDVDSVDHALKMVLNGELYGFVFPMMVLNPIVQTKYVGQLRISGKTDAKASWSIGVQKDDPVLFSIFDKMVREMTTDEKNTINSKWLFLKYTPEYDYSLIWKIGIFFTLLLSGVLYWNRRLLQHRSELDAKNKELEDEKSNSDHIAYHDHLTGLANRISLSRTLEHSINIAQRHGKLLGLLFIDLDRFKIVNDTLGHHVGDEMLKVVAERIASVLRETDVLARIGGDEFVVLIEALKDQNEAAIVAEKILKSLKTPIYVDEYELTTTASIGIALYPDDGNDTNTLIKNADSAMYLAKEEGKNGFRYYTKRLSDEVHDRLTIEHHLRNALKNDEFSLVFQPQYELKTNKIVAAEALLRWDRHDRKIIPPDKFIPIAEDTGVIMSIGRWVFLNACKEFLRWESLGLAIGQISINVSSVQFDQGALEEFTAMIKEVDISASSVELEITERYVMEHTQSNQDILDGLRAIGFKIAIDDFGTGYSSMSYLKTLPLDTIKIDKSFIDDIPDDPNDVAITKAILVLAKSLGYSVVAEGIEQTSQEDFLKEHACDIAQGYLFSRPLPPDDFISFVKGHQG